MTAYARANLFSGILACGNDYVYADTDSIKILNPSSHVDYIERYNNEILDKIKRSSEFHRIPIEDYSPLTIKGKPKTIGFWDDEGTYSRFKTIGAKRYITEKDGECELTVAGLNKKTAIEYIKKVNKDPFDGLHDKLKVPPEYSGRLTATYFDIECEGDVIDCTGKAGHYHELSYIHMEPSEYEIGVTPEFKAFVNFLYGIKEDSW